MEESWQMIEQLERMIEVNVKRNKLIRMIHKKILNKTRLERYIYGMDYYTHSA